MFVFFLATQRTAKIKAPSSATITTKEVTIISVLLDFEQISAIIFQLFCLLELFINY